MTSDRLSRAVACLRGLAVGDAIGACFFIPDNQPLLADRVLPPDPWYWTDDTEMACSIVTTLAEHGGIAVPGGQDALAASFAARHDFDRGYGAGVNRMLRLIRAEGGDWRALSREMFDGRGSWGNGGAMRVAPLGAWFADDLDRVAGEAEASARVTHTHDEGVAGAVAVAVATALAVSRPTISPRDLLDETAERTPPGLVRDGIGTAMTLLPLTDPRSAAASLGNGRYISAPDTVPFCLWAAAKHLDDFESALWDTALVGGDIDTNCAIVGGVVGARVGVGRIPAEWLARCEALPSWAGLDDETSVGSGWTR